MGKPNLYHSMPHSTNDSATRTKPERGMLEARFPVESVCVHTLLAPISITCGSIIWGYVDDNVPLICHQLAYLHKALPEASHPFAMVVQCVHRGVWLLTS